MRPPSRHHAGFTLIELLVVVAILSLLVTLLLPVLSKAKHLAKSAVCLSSQRQIGIALAGYQSEYSGMYPTPFKFEKPVSYSNFGETDHLWWTRLLWHELIGGSSQIIYCPSRPGPPNKTYPNPSKPVKDWVYKRELLKDASYPGGAWHGSLGMLNYGNQPFLPETLKDSAGLSIQFARKPVLMDCSRKASTLNTLDKLKAAMGNPYSDPAGSGSGNHSFLHGRDYLSLRHGYTANTLFFDGHAANLSSVLAWRAANKEEVP